MITGPYGEELNKDVGMRTSDDYSVNVNSTAKDDTRQKYAGMERDESGLDHADWRKYESINGRWTSPDPYSGSMSPDDPQSLNRYAYVQSDPVNYVDPSGLLVSAPCGVTSKLDPVTGEWKSTVNKCMSNDMLAFLLSHLFFTPSSGVDLPNDISGGTESQKSNQQLEPDELVLCDKDVKERIDKLVRDKLQSRGVIGKEQGFRVDKDPNGGQIGMGDIITGQSEEVNVPLTTWSVARVHTHPHSPFPSPQDRKNADDFYKQRHTGYLSVVITQGRVTLYNPRVPKDKSGHPRIVDLICPP